MRKNSLPDCPVELTMNLLQDRWNFLILAYLTLEEMTAGELKNQIGIDLEELRQHLSYLKKAGFIKWEGERYALNDLGVSLTPVILAMKDWGEAFQFRNRPHNLTDHSSAKLSL